MLPDVIGTPGLQKELLERHYTLIDVGKTLNAQDGVLGWGWSSLKPEEFRVRVLSREAAVHIVNLLQDIGFENMRIDEPVEQKSI